MDQDIFTEDCRTHITRVERLVERVEQWKIDHNEANRVCKLEYTIGQCIGMSDSVLSLAKEFSECGETLGFPTFHDAATILLGFFRSALNQCNRVKDQALFFEGKGYEVERLQELAQRIEQLDDGFARAEVAWPVVNDERIGRARLLHDAGQSQTAKEIADELRRKDSSEYSSGN